KRRPYDTNVQFVSIPVVRAAIDLNHGQYSKVIDELDGAMVYGRINTGVIYLRGLAFLKMGRANDAVQAFQRMLDLRAVSTFDPALSVGKVGLGRAYAMQGDNARSRVAYQDFFSLWKDADPDVPLLREAK